MRTAETIIKEYLELGYSPESLRVLAESRSEPLCSEMLGILASLRDSSAPEVVCETAECDVFFVASDDETVSGEDGVDFDIMAGVPAFADGEADVPAAAEESVAELLVGESEGTELVPLEQSGGLPGLVEDIDSGAGVWSVRFAEKDAESHSEPVPDERPEEPLIPIEPEAAEVAAAPEPEAVGEHAESTEPEPAVAEHEPPEAVSEPETAEESATPGETIESPEPVDESDAVEPAAASEETAEMQARVNLNPEVVAALQSILQEQSAPVPASVTGGSAEGEANRKMSRKERRRRERAAKKKGKAQKGQKNGAASLPEIVMTRSEGTETLFPELDGLYNTEDDAVVGNEIAECASEPAAEASEPVCLADENDVMPLLTMAEPPIDEAVDDAGESPEAADEPEPESVSDAVAGESVEIPAEDSSAVEAAEADSGVTRAVEEHIPPAEQESTDVVLSALHDETAEIDAPLDMGEEEAEAMEARPLVLRRGGFALTNNAYSLLPREFDDGGEDYEPEGSGDTGANVILFRGDFDAPEVDEVEDEAEMAVRPMLRMLPPVEPEAVTDADAEEAKSAEIVAETAAEPSADIEEQPEAVEPAAEADAPEPEVETPPIALSDAARTSLIRALGGLPEDVAEEDAFEASDGEHVILSVAPEAEDSEAAAAVAAQIEREYQERLDEFAARLLEVQAATAESDARVREREAALAAKEAELAEARNQLSAEGEKLARLGAELNDARNENAAKRIEGEKFQALRDEHRRLFAEFEDLRVAYNEVVTDVLPELQGERDNLILTVERQCAEGQELRGSLRNAKRRMTVSHSLAAAACLMLVTLPVFNWLRSDAPDREIAMDFQRSSEMRDMLDKAEQRNVKLENEVFNLRQDVHNARLELASLQDKNQELARIASLPVNEGSGLRPGVQSGNPTRTSVMALQGLPADSRLRVNEVRDPAGSIEQTYAMNRSRGAQSEDALAQGGDRQRIPVNAVAQAVTPDNVQRRGQPLRPDPQRQRRNEVTAKVKAGEGVAQVVYRVLGTRDPEVINWVIRENNIKKDRRGNPRIYPEQELRLPKEGRLTQAASAAGR